MDLIIIKSTVAYMNFRNLQEKFYKLLSKDKIMEFQMSQENSVYCLEKEKKNSYEYS